ncbi:MAG: hypothetical protein JWN72_250 [Thermoleophilia bacterium]|nr:hypothetical protein [Thermoleophilia bacterium]
MAHPAHVTHDATPDPHPGAEPRLHVVAAGREVDVAALAAARDELFRDADRHGPRTPVMVLRAAIALPMLAAVLLASTRTPWRSALIDAVPMRIADLLIIAPVLAALVFVATMLAPLARTNAAPLLGMSLLLVGVASWLTRAGSLSLAAFPLAVAGIIVGVVAARALRRAVWALPVLLAAGVSDAQSVRGGVTEDLLSSVATDGSGARVAARTAMTSIDPSLVLGIDFLVLHVPVVTGMWLLGFVDVVAVGLLLGLTHLFWLPMGRTALALGAALVLTAGAGAPVPVLPALGAAWVLANLGLVWRSTRFSLRRLMYLGG